MRTRNRDLVAFREQLGVSQAELGRRLGVDQATVSRWERGLQAPEPRVQVRLSELMYRQDLARGMRPEIALVEHSPFPMAIISRDWTVIALSDAILLRTREEFREDPGKQRKDATADMEQAVSLLSERGFFDGKVSAARIVARGFMLWRDQQPFEAVCTPVTIDGQICRLMQYVFLSEQVFVKRRKRFGLMTILSNAPREALLKPDRDPGVA
ncbi:helix-turn-helix domain-containing protein [Dongia sedimenti]|uniref:Helix-turn-helix transcriptional regulator n=1 Tax=Dongia sedimenti TaxID=3064282 RepID=A0ABU0YI54_9PROT|nr:helix-turn-helix transcriptional regulator [Rhodospirillaceae bacterium R-7]